MEVDCGCEDQGLHPHQIGVGDNVGECVLLSTKVAQICRELRQ